MYLRSEPNCALNSIHTEDSLRLFEITEFTLFSCETVRNKFVNLTDKYNFHYIKFMFLYKRKFNLRGRCANVDLIVYWNNCYTSYPCIFFVLNVWKLVHGGALQLYERTNEPSCEMEHTDKHEIRILTLLASGLTLLQEITRRCNVDTNEPAESSETIDRDSRYRAYKTCYISLLNHVHVDVASRPLPLKLTSSYISRRETRVWKYMCAHLAL